MGSEGNAKLRQRSYPPIPARSRWGDPTMPPHHVKVSGPRGLGGWRGWGVGGALHPLVFNYSSQHALYLGVRVANRGPFWVGQALAWALDQGSH